MSAVSIALFLLWCLLGASRSGAFRRPSSFSLSPRLHGSGVTRRNSKAKDIFDLDRAIMLAQASEVAYKDKKTPEQKEVVYSWARTNGYEKVKIFGQGKPVHGFYCWNEFEKDALLIFSGTDNPRAWIINLSVDTTSHQWGHVHLGFHSAIYEKDIASELTAFYELVGKEHYDVTIAGHSLGGALAVMAAARLKIETKVPALVYTFGQPLVGLEDFADAFSKKLSAERPLYRVINNRDVVTRIPYWSMKFAPYKHMGCPMGISDQGIQILRTKQDAVYGKGNDADDRSKLNEWMPRLSMSSEGVLEYEFAEPEGLSEYELEPLTEEEFKLLREALEQELRPPMAGAFGIPLVSDHEIAEYIRKMKEIRDREKE